MLSSMGTPVCILLGFDVLRQIDPFSPVTETHKQAPSSEAPYSGNTVREHLPPKNTGLRGFPNGKHGKDD